MPPQQQSGWVLFETDAATEDKAVLDNPEPSAEKVRWQIVWRNIFIIGSMHLGGLYGAYLFLTQAMWTTQVVQLFFCPIATILYLCSGLGITAGAHRLWAHKSYKAKWPLRLMLVVFNTIAFQDAVFKWVRDHRMHHKYSETDADPYNATRGFFFSHVGWLLVRKHPQIKAKAHTIDLSDIWDDPILRFQKKHYLILALPACIILPSVIPTLWGESLSTAFFVCALFRFIFLVNAIWLVNSLAHLYGTKPYDKNINPVETKPLALFILGEGFHNYHHTFPWDYKAAELGHFTLNFTRIFIEAMSWIGWAYDLKTVSTQVIEKRVKRTGDGTHPVWGWDDTDVPTEVKEVATVFNPAKKE